MSENEYLFNMVSKLPKFAYWVEQYNDFYPSSFHPKVLIFPFLLILPLFIVFICFDKRQSNKDKKPLPQSYLFTLITIVVFIDLVAITVNDVMKDRAARDLNSRTITLLELRGLSIDTNKIPKWAYDNLVDYGYLTYVDIYRGFLDSEQDKKD